LEALVDVSDTTGHLVREARAGDRAAFGRLVEIHWRAMVRLARSVVGELEAEDAVQDAMIAGWRALGGLRDEGTFPAWLRRIVLRKCLRRARWSRWTVLPEPGPDPAGPGNPERRLEILEILSNLAPRQRAVLHLTVVEGMSDTEIAGLLSMTAATGRAHRRRAREKIERLLAEGRGR
jgi:RNA polymerase sigma-70 factor (ECF subfamily)